ncbi:ABC transporter substrate-binding protein, partial [Gammaproteobacteria bacterium]|nr:ABC transporter substrate-binding protein [Gammaproteobacteria bacterium]
VSSSLIPGKTGTGESDLQARYLALSDFTFLKQGEKNNDYMVKLWQSGIGSQIALYPNFNVADPQWRELFRDVRFRRALSLAVNRHEINKVVYFGLVAEGNNTVLEESPLFKEHYRSRWASYDPIQAAKLLDEIGLTERNDRGIRLLPNGEPLQLIVQSAGESTEETDVLELVGDSWRGVGVELFIKPSQREVLRRRLASGDAMMAVWNGADNALATASMAPDAFVPSDDSQPGWSQWGNYEITNGEGGERCDYPPAQRLIALAEAWRRAPDPAEQHRCWAEILETHSDQVFSIGIVAGAPQPMVVNSHLRNVPERGIYTWSPTAYFGVYRIDTFWFEQ